MPNASTEVGGEIRRGTREENEGEGEDIKICFVFSFRRSHSNGTRLPGPPRLSGWSQIAFGPSWNVLWRAVRFCFLRRAAALYLPIASPFASPYACFRICIDGKRQGEREREEG